MKDIVYELTNKKMVRMGIFERDQVFLIHIRGYHIDAEKHHKPETGGVALNLEAWRALYKNIDHINFDVDRFA